MGDLISEASLSQLKSLMMITIPVSPHIPQQVPAASMKERGLKEPSFFSFFTFLGMAWTLVCSTHCILWYQFERPKFAWAPIMLLWSWALQPRASCCCHPWSNTCSQSPRFLFLHQHFSCSLYGTHLFMLDWQASQDQKLCICLLKYFAICKIMK